MDSYNKVRDCAAVRPQAPLSFPNPNSRSLPHRHSPLLDFSLTPPASLDVCMASWWHPTYARQRLETIRPAALQAVLVLESWFDVVLDAFPYSLWYEISENSECSPVVSQVRQQVAMGCSLHYNGRLDGARCVSAHSMPAIRHVAADQRIDVWLHGKTFWHHLARRLRTYPVQTCVIHSSTGSSAET